MRYSFDDEEAPTTRKRQYYAILGTRGIWQEGWKAASLHAPASDKARFDSDRWELYHVDEDRLESTNVADQYPDKLKELISAWDQEARDNFVLPLDDRSAADQFFGTPRPHSEPPRDRYVYYPDTAPVPEGVAVNIRGKSYKIAGNVDLEPDADGVIFAHGSRFGGHTLFIKDGRLHYVYNFLGIEPEQDFVSPPLTPGKHTLGMEFTREKAGEQEGTANCWAPQGTRFYVDGAAVTTGPMRAQIGDPA